MSAFAAVPARDLRSEWDLRADRFGAILDDPASAVHLPEKVLTVAGRFPTSTFPSGIIVDLMQHSADVSSALGRRPVAGPDNVVACNRSMASGLRRVWPSFDVASVVVHTADDGERYTFGENPTVELEASSFDLFRTFGGRRSIAQTLALDWTDRTNDLAAVAPHLTVGFFAAPDGEVEPAGIC